MFSLKFLRYNIRWHTSGGFRFYCVKRWKNFQEGAYRASDFWCLIQRRGEFQTGAYMWFSIMRQGELQMGAYVVFKLQGEKNLKRALSMVFLLWGKKDFKRAPIGHMVFIVRQGDFQEGVSMVILLWGKENFKRALWPYGFYCEARRLSRGRLDTWLFYCEARWISRGRLHGILLWDNKNFKRTPIWFLIPSWREFQAGRYMFFYCKESRISRENLYGFECGAKRISKGRLRLHGYL